jgi:hypothetical protein
MLKSGAERIIRAAMRSWVMTLRLCLIVGVIAAPLTIVVCLVDPSVLLVFRK